MAMMMAGRVLLVCALCVLWCGAGGGGCSEAAPAVPGTGVSGNGNNLESKNNTTDGVGGGRSIGQQATSQAAGSLVQNLPGTEAESALRTGAKESGTAEEKIENKKKTENGENEEANQDTDEEEEKEDDGKEEEGEEERKEEEKDDTSTTKTKSAGGQEEPILSSRVEEASNKTKPQRTQKTGNKDPAADGAGTQEEKQKENKEANPKETPVEATAMKTTTPTTGDSDSSTAVSHTNSHPLHLIVTYACCCCCGGGQACMKWCAPNMNDGRWQLNCFCDEYWLHFPWTNNPRGVQGSLLLFSYCYFAFVLLCALHLLLCVCVPSVRGADTTDRSRRMCMRWSLVCVFFYFCFFAF
ncbi:Mucin-associated surface protein (MASP) [Trypanosoma cruzi]|uniref:Mucin-associated surface protein (MASP) n=1 Tax=Trypanosoma cruzi TaxID=5693 RepID=A0A2V2XL38_TRYCR|nr:Mucin-associated surface protein (MASP) [Trypanosoma cruzi]